MRRGRCESCGKAFRVADGARSPKCKDCGGKVALIEEETRAENPSPPPDPGEAIEQGLAAETGRRLDASRKLGRARRAIGTLRAFYAVNAFVAGAVTLFFILALLSVPEDSIDAEVSAGLIGAAALMVVIFGVMVAGAVLVARQPRVWSIVIASLFTVSALLDAIGGSSTVVMGINGFWTICLWAAVAVAFRMSALIEQHPDLWIAKRLRGEREAVRGGAVYAKSRASGREARSRTLKRVLLFGTAGVVGFVGVYFALKTLAGGTGGGPVSIADAPPFEPVAARFAEAWNASRHAAITDFCRAESRERMARSFRRICERRNWDETLPRVGVPTLQEGKGAVMNAVFPLESGGAWVKTTWQATSAG